jgi:hypothetical protein
MISSKRYVTLLKYMERDKVVGMSRELNKFDD